MKANFLKWSSILLLVGGAILLTYSSYHIISQDVKENKALAQAQYLLKEKKNLEKDSLPPMEYSFGKGDVLGILSIPKLEKELPIIEGTDEAELEKGVGHYSQTKLPGQKDLIFLAGHRDTVFKQMEELQVGDELTIQMDSGIYKYKIFETLVVKETDLSVLHSTNPQEILTLSTCYPFEYLSSTTERYIINAKRVE